MFVNPKSVETFNIQGIKGDKVMPFCTGTRGPESSSPRSWVRKPGAKRKSSQGREEERDGGDLFQAPREGKKSSFH